MALPNPLQLLSQSWQLYRSHWKTFIKLVSLSSLVLLLGGLLLSLLFLVSVGQLIQLPVFVWLPLLLIGTVFLVLVAALTQMVLLLFINNPSQTGLIPLIKQAWPWLLPFLLTKFLANLITSVGFLLLIVPGIIFWVRYIFVPFIIIAEGVSDKAALSQSSIYVKGKFWPILGRALVIILISVAVNLLSGQVRALTLPLSIVSVLFVAPLTTIYFFYLYQAVRTVVN